MNHALRFILHCAFFVFICHSDLKFGVMANLMAWEAKMEEHIVKLGQELFSNDLDLLDEHLSKFMVEVQEIPVPMTYDLSKKLGRRLTTPLLRAMECCNQIRHRSDNFQQSASEEYLAHLIVRIRSIIVALGTEFHTFVMEVEHEQLANGGWTTEKLAILIEKFDKFLAKNEIYCAKESYKLAKNVFARLVGDGGMEERHQEEEIVDEGEKCQEIAIGIKLSVLEGEMEAKITAYSTDPIDGDGLMAFSRDFLNESKEIRQFIDKLANLGNENFREKLKNLAEIGQRLSKPLRQGIAQKLEELVGNSRQELERLQTEPGTAGNDRHKFKEFCANLLAHLQVVGILPRFNICNLVKENEHLANDQSVDQTELFNNFGRIYQLIKEQKKEILKSFDFDFDMVGEFRRSLSIREHLQMPH